MTTTYAFSSPTSHARRSFWPNHLASRYSHGISLFPAYPRRVTYSGNRIANLTFYDIKSAWTQAKNYALNISEIEAKVNEATSDDPWGASSTLMQEISQATNNFSDFNEIMPAIFRNFMEREANEWRQIYKVGVVAL